MLRLVRQAELTGRRPKSLVTLPNAFDSRLDAQCDGLASLLRKLMAGVSESAGSNKPASEASIKKLFGLVTEIANKICPTPDGHDLADNGDMFVLLDGHAVLISLIECQVREVGDGGLQLSPECSKMLNEVIRIITELVATADHHAGGVSAPPAGLARDAGVLARSSSCPCLSPEAGASQS